MRWKTDAMWLHGVIADNFRCFRHTEISLPEAGLVLIAGANNTGKKALLSALDVIAGDSGDTTSLRHVGGDDPAQVTARFCLSEAERASLLTKTPYREQLLTDGALAVLDFLLTKGLREQADLGCHWRAALRLALLTTGGLSGLPSGLRGGGHGRR
jgi:hypothetical protein